jgi:hypothetical protein
MEDDLNKKQKQKKTHFFVKNKNDRLKNIGRRPEKQKMEDNLKNFFLNWRRPKKIIKQMENELEKNIKKTEDYLKKIIKMEDLTKMEDNLKKI